MTQNMNPFQPTPGSGQPISLVAPASVQQVSAVKGDKQICVVITGPATGVNVRVNPPGDATPATANDLLILPTFPPILTKDADGTTISLFCAAGGGTGQVISGNGNR